MRQQVRRWRLETEEQFPGPALRLPGSKRINQKVDILLRIAAPSPPVLAVYDLGLLRMQLQLALRKPLLQRVAQAARLRFAATMADNIIGIALKRDIGVVLPQPAIKRIVEKEISQGGANNRSLWRPFLSVHQRAIRH